MSLQPKITEEDFKYSNRIINKNTQDNLESQFQTSKISDKERIHLMEENIASIELQVSELKEYLEHIFNGYVLIDGKFKTKY